MDLVLVTGMSGAGKSTVLHLLEDRNYFCVDNLPPSLLQVFCDLLESHQEVNKAAVGIDIRSGDLGALPEVIHHLQNNEHHVEIIFLEADDKTLMKRYQETRRVHPLRMVSQIQKAIETERTYLSTLKSKADYILDTSKLLTRQLRHQIDVIISKDEAPEAFVLDIRSFGFKHGILEDGDMIFDVRFLPNPFYEESLRKLTGNDQSVYEYVMNTKQAQDFLAKLEDLVSYLIPRYKEEGRHKLVIGIGCTGGHHRSVSMVRALKNALQKEDGYKVCVYHRDITLS